MQEIYRRFNKLYDFKPYKAIHLAAISSAVDANQKPNIARYSNKFTKKFTIIMYESSLCNHVCFMSSSTVYGDFETDVVDETIDQSQRFMQISILAREWLEKQRHYMICYTIIRPSALYGIRCISGRVSQKFIENALEGKPLY